MVTRGRLLTITAPFILVTTVLAQSNAVKLRPSGEYWDRGRRPTVHFSNLYGKRRLASVGDTLYMFTERDKLLWTWSTGGPPLTDTPVEDVSGVIYAIGLDLTAAVRFPGNNAGNNGISITARIEGARLRLLNIF
jgi:hypothetical protein